MFVFLFLLMDVLSSNCSELYVAFEDSSPNKKLRLLLFLTRRLLLYCAGNLLPLQLIIVYICGDPTWQAVAHDKKRQSVVVPTPQKAVYSNNDAAQQQRQRVKAISETQ